VSRSSPRGKGPGGPCPNGEVERPGGSGLLKRNREALLHVKISKEGGGRMSLKTPAMRGVMGALFLTGLWGCSHVISPEMRAAAKEELQFGVVLADPERYHGETVIWGGVILATENNPEGTTLVVLETPLDWEGAPKDAEFSRGRFLARTSHFLDQAVYSQGRKVTLAGEVAGREVRMVGDLPYGYPVVSIREIHLWRDTAPAWAPAHPWGPYWYWGGPYWYWEWWWPRWGGHWRRR